MATIKEIQQRLELVTDLADPFLAEAANDQRSGVQKAIEKRKRAIQAELDEDLRLEQMLRYEKELYKADYQAIAGIDEVGRGPLAGPVVAAAVILPPECKIKGLNDSKKIPKKKHQDIYQAVLDKALAVGVGLMNNEIIDQVNIYEATKLAMKEALSKLSLAAASIVAKVTRDKLMADYDKKFPGYDFAKNAGYGTRSHLQGLERSGVTPIHRKTFEPIKSMYE